MTPETAPLPFAAFLSRWGLTPDGPARRTPGSDLLPVRWQGRTAMLKLARTAEEAAGHRLMVWWAGQGAARVYAHDGPALLMERLDREGTLAAQALGGQDSDATRVLCRAAVAVHGAGQGPWPALPDLHRWFRALGEAAGHGAEFAALWAVAQRCLAEQRDVRPLHGDLHHGNALHSAERGWVLIDPKGLIGDPAFEYANLLCNPTLAHALTPGRLEAQLAVIAQESGLDAARLARWAAAYAGLSAAWHLEDGQPHEAALTLRVAHAANLAPGR